MTKIILSLILIATILPGIFYQDLSGHSDSGSVHLNLFSQYEAPAPIQAESISDNFTTITISNASGTFSLTGNVTDILQVLQGMK